jgi:hypothetical protein
MTRRKAAKAAKAPRKGTTPRKRTTRTPTKSRSVPQATELQRTDETRHHVPPPPWTQSDLKPRRGGDPATSVTVKDEAEALFYFARIDERLAEAWQRDVVMHAGPITIHRVIGVFFDSTHYAYVDRRLIWYLRHDPSDPLGVRWEGYLKTAGDAPRGALVHFVGRDIMAKKSPPQITEGGA